ncbi:MAG TPA: tetratricopeptide repeat protein, partial [Fodinibius sp.]|nr:tetratricopeptide repeat protein [Fodinibius sp.]
MKQIEQQITEIKQELEASPENADLLNELGVGYHILGAYERAVETYRRSLANNPGNFKTHFNLANTFFE